MPGPMLHAGATATCPHGGTMNIVVASPRIMLGGMPAAVLSDSALIAGCAFTAGTKPQPCVSTRWLVAAARVTSNGVPLLISTAVGLCQSAEQLPGGPPIVSGFQTRVVAT